MFKTVSSVLASKSSDELYPHFQLIVVFAMVVAAFAGAVPGERQERQAVYSTYSGLVSPLAYSASPYAYSGVPAAVPAISTYSSYPGNLINSKAACKLLNEFFLIHQLTLATAATAAFTLQSHIARSIEDFGIDSSNVFIFNTSRVSQIA